MRTIYISDTKPLQKTGNHLCVPVTVTMCPCIAWRRHQIEQTLPTLMPLRATEAPFSSQNFLSVTLNLSTHI